MVVQTLNQQQARTIARILHAVHQREASAAETAEREQAEQQRAGGEDRG